MESIREEITTFHTGSMEIIDNFLKEAEFQVEDVKNEAIYSQKLFMHFLKLLLPALKRGDLSHADFQLENIQNPKLWLSVKKQILLLRIEELKSCKIVLKSRKYNISDLKSSYLGKFVAKKLGFGNRTILTKLEYEKLVFQIRRLNYELPVTIEPTTTEKFFQK